MEEITATAKQGMAAVVWILQAYFLNFRLTKVDQ